MCLSLSLPPSLAILLRLFSLNLSVSLPASHPSNASFFVCLSPSSFQFSDIQSFVFGLCLSLSVGLSVLPNPPFPLRLTLSVCLLARCLFVTLRNFFSIVSQPLSLSLPLPAFRPPDSSFGVCCLFVPFCLPCSRTYILSESAFLSFATLTRHGV